MKSTETIIRSTETVIRFRSKEGFILAADYALNPNFDKESGS